MAQRVRRGGLVVTALALVVWGAFWPDGWTQAQEEEDGRPEEGWSQVEGRRFAQDLDAVLSVQQEILDRLDEMLEEVKIVKIRAMRRRAPTP